MNARRLTLILGAVVTSAAASCKRTPDPPEPVIVGEIIDNFGHPIQGATISIRDSAYRAVTNAQGNFSLAFAPGSFGLTIQAPNCVPVSRDFQITLAVRYPLGTKMLFRVPEAPRDTVVVAAEAGYRPLPSVEFDSRVVTFGPTFPNRCAEFSLRRPVPTLRGKTLVVSVPDRNFQLVQVANEHVVTDPFPYTIGVCPGGIRRFEVRVVDAPNRAFLAAESPAPGTYCLIRSTRGDPTQAENSRGYCFQWTLDAQVRWGAVMADAPAPVAEAPMGQTAEDHERDTAEQARVAAEAAATTCPLRNGVIPCTEECYRANSQWPDPLNPADFFSEQRSSGECYGP